MTAILSLTAAAESTANHFADSGQPSKALDLIRRLLTRPESVGVTGARLHRLAAECLIRLSRFSAARKHLLLAHRADPADAETAYQLGERYEIDSDGDSEKATKWFLRSTKLAPRNPLHLASFGRAAIRMGQRKTGWKAIGEAVEMCPGSDAVLAIAVEACRMVQRMETARRWVTRGRFLSSNRTAMNRLWDTVRFDMASHLQHRNETVVRTVPFLRLVGGESTLVRKDKSSKATPHFLRLVKMSGR